VLPPFRVPGPLNDVGTSAGIAERRGAMTLPAMAPRFPELQDAGWLRQKYELDGQSSYAIAAELGCRATTASRALGRHGIGARMGRPAVVAPGEVYGRLTVLSELPVRSRGGRVFRCRCTCGRETEARAAELRQGKVRSRGCLLDEARESGHSRPPRVHSGERYGRLVVLHETGRESPRHARLFSCRCDCGNTTTVRGANLTGSHTRSCGCLLEEYRQRGTRGRRTAAGPS
jgi:hypothetical protein